MPMNKIVYWVPRILAILFILFLAMFSLDVFEEGRTWQQIAIGLFMHNIPVLVLAAVLVISWKREIVGGVAFIMAGLLYVALIVALILANGFTKGIKWYMLTYPFIIAGPAFLVGGLFLVGWRQRKSGK
jgi:hypothetical protein